MIFVEKLKEQKLIDTLVHYDTRSFSKQERKEMISPYADESGLFQGGVETIAEQVRIFSSYSIIPNSF